MFPVVKMAEKYWGVSKMAEKYWGVSFHLVKYLMIRCIDLSEVCRWKSPLHNGGSSSYTMILQ